MYSQIDTCRRSIGVVQTSPCAGDSLPAEQTCKPLWSGQVNRQPVQLNGGAWTNMTAWQNLNRIKKVVISLEAEMTCDRITISQEDFLISLSGRPRSLEGNCGLPLPLISEKFKWCPHSSEAVLYSMTACPSKDAFWWSSYNTNWKGNWCWKMLTESPLNHFKNSLHKFSSSWLQWFLYLKAYLLKSHMKISQNSLFMWIVSATEFGIQSPANISGLSLLKLTYNWLKI